MDDNDRLWAAREERDVNRQFDAAERHVARAALRVERAIDALLDKASGLDHVALDYVFERLLVELIKRNPKALAYLNKQEGDASVQLTNALMDWRDLWNKR